MNGLANYYKLTKTAEVELFRHCFYHQVLYWTLIEDFFLVIFKSLFIN
jgi:hypothetical protein